VATAIVFLEEITKKALIADFLMFALKNVNSKVNTQTPQVVNANIVWMGAYLVKILTLKFVRLARLRDFTKIPYHRNVKGVLKVVKPALMVFLVIPATRIIHSQKVLM